MRGNLTNDVGVLLGIGAESVKVHLLVEVRPRRALVACG